MTTSSALQPVRVEDWVLFREDGDFWIRDLDLAERAGLEKPRNIRAVSKKAIAEGALPTIAGGAGDGGSASGGPLVRAEKVLTPIGSGAVREVDEFYLNEEAALFIVTRLRTKLAIDLTRSIISVFVAVKRGALARPAHVSPALEATLGALLAEFRGNIAGLHGNVAELHGKLDELRRDVAQLRERVLILEVDTTRLESNERMKDQCDTHHYRRLEEVCAQLIDVGANVRRLTEDVADIERHVFPRKES